MARLMGLVLAGGCDPASSRPRPSLRNSRPPGPGAHLLTIPDPFCSVAQWQEPHPHPHPPHTRWLRVGPSLLWLCPKPAQVGGPHLAPARPSWLCSAKLQAPSLPLPPACPQPASASGLHPDLGPLTKEPAEGLAHQVGEAPVLPLEAGPLSHLQVTWSPFDETS